MLYDPSRLYVTAMATSLWKNNYSIERGFPGGSCGFPRGSTGKESTWRPGFDPWAGRVPWRRKWQPIPVFLLGKSHKQRSLAGYSPQGCKELGHDLDTK